MWHIPFLRCGKKEIKHGNYSHVLRSTFYISAWLQRPQSFAKKTKFLNDGERENFEVKDKESFEMDWALLLYTRAFRHYQQNLRSNVLKHDSYLKQFVPFWRKGQTLLKSIENVVLHLSWSSIVYTMLLERFTRRALSGRVQSLTF